jgi:hypothetical protein
VSAAKRCCTTVAAVVDRCRYQPGQQAGPMPQLRHEVCCVVVDCLGQGRKAVRRMSHPFAFLWVLSTMWSTTDHRMGEKLRMTIGYRTGVCRWRRFESDRSYRPVGAPCQPRIRTVPPTLRLWLNGRMSGASWGHEITNHPPDARRKHRGTHGTAAVLVLCRDAEQHLPLFCRVGSPPRTTSS